MRELDAFIGFINRVPRSGTFTAYDVNFPSRVKSRMLGVFSCFYLLKRAGRYRRSYVYEVTPLLARVPTSEMAWLYAISHAAASRYLHSLLSACGSGERLPVPPIKYLYYDVLRLLRSLFIIDREKRLTPLGKVLSEVGRVIEGVKKEGTFECRGAFERGAALLLKHLLILDREVADDLVKIYVSALIALSRISDFLGIDSLGTISVRVEEVLDVFTTFFRGDREEFFSIIENARHGMFIEADKDPSRAGFLVVSAPEITIRGSVLDVRGESE